MSETIERLAEGVWVGIPGLNEGAMAAVVDGSQMLVLDTTSYNVFASRFVTETAAAEGCPGPTLLYISHRHFDHFGGADAIDAPVIGHRLTREAMSRYTQEWLDRSLAGWIEEGAVVPELVRAPKIVLPEILFESRLIVQVGRFPVELLHVGGHCADQTVAYLPEQRVLFASDNVFNGKEPYTGDGDLVAWIESLERMRALPVEVVIPGHGPVGGPELLTAQQEQLEGLLATSLGTAS